MKRKLFSVMILAAMSAFGFAVSASAQEAAPAADAAAAQTDKKSKEVKEKTLGDMWNAGGWTMYPLAFCGIACISLAVVNALSIRTVKFADPKDVKELEALLNNVDVEGALTYCAKKSSPLTNILGAGLARVNEKEVEWEAVQEAMEESSIEEMAAPYVMVNYLALIASIAPMMGLFGTVTGMVKAFNTIAAEGAGSAQKLADNISEALITTATGMIVGIPAMFFFFYFKNSYGKVSSGISRVLGDLIYTFKMAKKYGPQQLDADAPVAENK